MDFLKISYEGINPQIIAARSKYEAVGFYLFKNYKEYVGYSDLTIEHLPADHKVEVECVGFPVYKTVKEMFNELEEQDLPVIICELSE